MRVQVGAKIDLLEVVRPLGRQRAGKMWECRCTWCGELIQRTELSLRAAILREGGSGHRSCIDARRSQRNAERLLQRWGGVRVGQVTPVRLTDPSGGHQRFRCSCACGGHVDVAVSRLERAVEKRIDIGCRACRTKDGRPMVGSAEVSDG